VSLFASTGASAATDDGVSPVDVKPGDERLIVDPSSRDSGISREVFEGIAAIRDYGPKVHPEVYTGISTNDPESVDILVIYLTSADPAVQEEFAVASGVPREKLKFGLSSRTEIGFAELNAQFPNDRAELAANGIDIQGWGVGAGHVEEVYVKTSDEGIAQLKQRYGDDITYIRDWDPAMFQDAGRVDDNPEWYGGNFLDVDGGGGCTNSFPLRWIGHTNQYILTAGHCGQNSQWVRNRAKSPINIGTGTVIGQIAAQTYNPNGYDAALIVADGSRGIWTGSSAAPNGVITVQAVSDTWDGAPACLSGAYDGESCAWRMRGTPTCFPWTSPTNNWCNLQRMENIASNGVQTAGQGDSGGPVYASINGVVYGFGMLKGVGYSTICSNWNTQFQGSRSCGKWAYIHRLSGIMNQWNLELDP
jgi:hypothetical protein